MHQCERKINLHKMRMEWTGWIAKKVTEENIANSQRYKSRMRRNPKL